MTLGVARSGVVRTINVVDGDRVEAGHILIALDDARLAEAGRKMTDEGYCDTNEGGAARDALKLTLLITDT
jgi:multidrug efflux pump subunit AcrA (membrane-fusion protein)